VEPSRVAGISSAGDVVLWDSATGQELHKVARFSRLVYSVRFVRWLLGQLVSLVDIFFFCAC
jgi:hypothetical protein